MKRLWKVLLIMGLVCVLAGGIFAAVLGFCFSDEIVAHKEHFIFENYVSFLDNFRWRDRFYLRQDGLYYNASECKESCYYEVAKEEIHTICFEFAVGEIRIITGETMSVQVTDMFENAISSEVEDGVWYIKDSLIEHGRVYSGYAPTIEIVLPAEKIFDKIQIQVAAGTFTAEELRAKEMILEVDAGSMQVQQLYSKERLELTNGVGEMTLLSVEANNVIADNGVGAMYISGKITGQNNIKCGIGEVNILLCGRDDIDFNYDVNCGIGEVVINNSKHYGMGHHHNNSHHGNTSSRDYFYLDCGIGCIRLDLE